MSSFVLVLSYRIGSHSAERYLDHESARRYIAGATNECESRVNFQKIRKPFCSLLIGLGADAGCSTESPRHLQDGSLAANVRPDWVSRTFAKAIVKSGIR